MSPGDPGVPSGASGRRSASCSASRRRARFRRRCTVFTETPDNLGGLGVRQPLDADQLKHLPLGLRQALDRPQHAAGVLAEAGVAAAGRGRNAGFRQGRGGGLFI